MKIKKSFSIEMEQVEIEFKAEPGRLQAIFRDGNSVHTEILREALSDKDANEIVRTLRAAQNHAFDSQFSSNTSARLAAKSRSTTDLDHAKKFSVFAAENIERVRQASEGENKR